MAQTLIEKLREEQAKKAALASSTPPSTPPPAGAPTAREKLEAAATQAVTSVMPPAFVVPPVAAVPPPSAQVPSDVAEAGQVFIPAVVGEKIAAVATRGRKGRAAVTTTVIPTSVPDSAIALPPRPGPGRVTVVPSAGFELCVNCAPTEPYVLFSKFVAVVHQALKEAKGWDHYALYSFEGTAAYQDCLRQVLEQDPPGGVLVVDSSTNEGRDAMPILERAAYRVTRGWR